MIYGAVLHPGEVVREFVDNGVEDTGIGKKSGEGNRGGGEREKNFSFY